MSRRVITARTPNEISPEDSVLAGINDVKDRITAAREAASGLVEGFNAIAGRSKASKRQCSERFYFTEGTPGGSENYVLSVKYRDFSIKSNWDKFCNPFSKLEVTVTPKGNMYMTGHDSPLSQDKILRETVALAVKNRMLPRQV